MRVFSRAACLTLALALAGAAFSDAGQSKSGHSRADAVRLLERGTITDKEQPLREGRQILVELLDQRLDPREALIVHYSVAYADWRIVGSSETNASKVGPLLEDAVRQLQEALKLDSRYAEAQALLGTIYGSQIGVDPSRSIFLGPDSSNAIARAVGLQPNNPRVILQHGINTFFTPTEFGGGPDKAEPLLQRAVALFENEPRDAAWPNWGRLDTLAYLGIVKTKRGDREGARAVYEKALRLAPDYRWVRMDLLPKLERPGR